MEFDPSLYLVVGLVIFISLVLTAIYYFARYTIKIEPHDKEVFKLLEDKEKAPQDAKDLVSPKGQLRPEPIKLKKLKTVEEALAGTRASLWGRMAASLGGGSSSPTEELEAIEEVLFTSDLGPKAAQSLLEAVGDQLKSSEKRDPARVREALKSQMLSRFPRSTSLFDRAKDLKTQAEMAVWMIVGVNGAGKTTTIGKLASQAVAQGLKVMIVAGDTFRAAADSQLKVWAERSGSLYFSAENTKDPSAVAYQALEKAKSENVHLVLVDTAGRLHTQENLMEELKKIRRVMAKVSARAPHEVIIVLDANSGQNALEQARQFHRTLELTGAIITKLDGTSKGGVAVGLVSEIGIPIQFIGIGESIEDLRAFSPEEFVNSIL